MLKRYGEISGIIFRNHGYCPYNQCTKYKLSYNGEVNYIYVDNYKQLKEEIKKLSGELNEKD